MVLHRVETKWWQSFPNVFMNVRLQKYGSACLGLCEEHRKQWLARFRKRWGLGYGTLKAQELMCVEEKRQKVALTRIICGVQAKVGPGIRSAAVANLGQLAVPNLGPRGGPKFGTAGTKNVKAGPKLSPSDGARFGPSI